MRLGSQFPSLGIDSKAPSSFLKIRLSPDTQDYGEEFLSPGSGVLGVGNGLTDTF